MLRRRPALQVRPALDDQALHKTLTELRPERQLHGLGADSSQAVWEPVAELLRTTGHDWDRRTHRISVLARSLPPAICERWAADRPADGDALALRAFVQVTGAAEGGRAAARSAEQACLRAAEACPEDPTPWLALLSLMRSFAVPVHDAVPIWTEAVTRAPWHRTAYHDLLRYLSPRGYGNVPDMLDFARMSADRAPYGSPVALLPVAARVEVHAHRLRQSAMGAGRDWNEPQIAEEIDIALYQWFDAGAPPHAESLIDLNVLAFALVQAYRPDDAGRVLKRIGRHMTPHPWNLLPQPERTFRYWSGR
ncbi:hypothetical protein AB0K02_33760 [Streptomyces sp. NPDC049597]|uniref:hypothetical protein n=1 Tax=Streptomyces sp. NPDC049597 TaxID=3155276 RepID=UPI003430AC24